VYGGCYDYNIPDKYEITNLNPSPLRPRPITIEIHPNIGGPTSASARRLSSQGEGLKGEESEGE
jgi:hypothetical protein